MDFSIATDVYLNKMCEITDQAKRQLQRLGVDQWQSGYPSRDVWEQDIANACSYVAIDDGVVQGFFAYMTKPDPSYNTICGAWFTDGNYASLHRVCVADEYKGLGVAGQMFAFACKMSRDLGLSSVRVDTHAANLPMCRALIKAGFQYCGEIELVDGCEKGSSRIAFEKLLLL